MGDMYNIKSRAELKQLFSEGKLPTEKDFANIFDSFLSLNDDGIQLSEDVNKNIKFKSNLTIDGKIYGVADGVNATDAINKRQLDSSATETLNLAKIYAAVSATETLNLAKIYAAVDAYVLGEYRFIAGNTTPAKFLLCNGAAVSKTTYSALFEVIGTSFGGANGGATFNLPDLRGKVVAGVSATSSMGVSAGLDSQALTTAQLPTHSHSATETAVAAYNVPTNALNIVSCSRSPYPYYPTDSGSVYYSFHPGNGESWGGTPASNTHSHSISVASSGSSSAVDMRQATCYAGNWYIYAGI